MILGGDSGVQPSPELIDCQILEVGETNSEQPVDLNFYHFVQALHVLEHVGNPLSALRVAMERCHIGGYVYIEVPMEHPGLGLVKSGEAPNSCNEHINAFSLKSIKGLASAVGGEILLAREDSMKTIHRGSMLILRLLIVKN